MTLFKVSILEGSKVLLLEDSEMRISWFKKRIPNLTITKSVKEFKEYVETKPTIDFVFWDHDLGEGGDGYEAASWMAEKFSGTNRFGLIHSWNRAGAIRMQSVLKATQYIPFGEFDIEIV